MTPPNATINQPQFNHLAKEVKVSSKQTLQLFGLSALVCLMSMALGALMRNVAPNLFLVLFFPLLFLFILTIRTTYSSFRALFKKSWISFTGSGMEDHCSLLRLGRIPSNDLLDVKWVGVGGVRCLRIKLEKKATVFYDWDEPKGILIDFYRLLVGPRVYIPAHLIENNDDISNEWTKKFTAHINSTKINTKSRSESAGPGRRPAKKGSLADQFRKEVEGRAIERQNTEPSQVRSGSSIHIDPGTQYTEHEFDPDSLPSISLEATVATQAQMPGGDLIYGFTDRIRPMVTLFNREEYGHLVTSVERSDSTMTQERTCLLLASGNQLEFIVRYDAGEDQTVFEIVWNSQLVFAQHVELEIRSMTPVKVLSEESGPWRDEVIQLYQALESIS